MQPRHSAMVGLALGVRTYPDSMLGRKSSPRVSVANKVRAIQDLTVLHRESAVFRSPITFLYLTANS